MNIYIYRYIYIYIYVCNFNALGILEFGGSRFSVQGRRGLEAPRKRL